MSQCEIDNCSRKVYRSNKCILHCEKTGGDTNNQEFQNYFSCELVKYFFEQGHCKMSREEIEEITRDKDKIHEKFSNIFELPESTFNDIHFPDYSKENNNYTTLLSVIIKIKFSKCRFEGELLVDDHSHPIMKFTDGCVINKLRLFAPALKNSSFETGLSK